MKVCEIIEKLNLVVYSGEEGLDREVSGGYVSDLLSDVLAFAREDQVWVTLHPNKNVMAVASARRLSAVILVKGIRPGKEMLKCSETEAIPVLGTEDSTFEITGKLYALLHRML